MTKIWQNKDLTKRTASDKVLRDKSFDIVSIPKYDGYERGLASIFTNFLTKNQKVAVLNLCQINNLHINFINQLLENFFK